MKRSIPIATSAFAVVLLDVVNVVHGTVQPAHASLWVKEAAR